jgi:hypothetical protein
VEFSASSAIIAPTLVLTELMVPDMAFHLSLDRFSIAPGAARLGPPVLGSND